MKVAILNRARDAYPGGDLIAIDELIRELKTFDVQATYIGDPWNPKTLQAYDLVHIFHCNFGWSRMNFEGATESGVPYVVTPVFYPTGGLGIDFPEMARWLRAAKKVMPFSRTEASELMKDIGAVDITIIPNGTSRQFHHDVMSNGRIGVLTVSARADGKNTGLVREACSELKLPYFHAECVPRAMMPGMYHRALVFVNASPSERMSLTIGEALCGGCRVLATVHNRGNEWYPGLATIDAEFDEPAFRERLALAYKAAVWDYRPNIRAKSMTWTETARQTVEVYRKAIL